MSYIQRMKEELDGLDGRLSKLQAFVKTGNYEDLTLTEQRDLTDQLLAMTLYSNILSRRYERAYIKSISIGES